MTNDTEINRHNWSIKSQISQISNKVSQFEGKRSFCYTSTIIIDL